MHSGVGPKDVLDAAGVPVGESERVYYFLFLTFV